MHLFYFYCSGDHRDLHSFPTRRSSDLVLGVRALMQLREDVAGHGEHRNRGGTAEMHRDRSEEHTSELQSRQYLVCRLLLEKKKQSGVMARPSPARGA